MRIDTVAVHAGAAIDPATGAVTPAIHPSTTFEREPDGSFPHGHIYSRSSAPNLAAVEKAVRPNTKLVWAESPSNPLWKVSDLAAVGAIARSAGARYVVDSTAATPILQSPFK